MSVELDFFAPSLFFYKFQRAPLQVGGVWRHRPHDHRQAAERGGVQGAAAGGGGAQQVRPVASLRLIPVEERGVFLVLDLAYYYLDLLGLLQT